MLRDGNKIKTPQAASCERSETLPTLHHNGEDLSRVQLYRKAEVDLKQSVFRCRDFYYNSAIILEHIHLRTVQIDF